MSSVSRSVYQKLKEENKRLIADIRVLVFPDDSNGWKPVLTKWRKKFEDDADFTIMLKEVARDYLKAHPEIKIPGAPCLDFCGSDDCIQGCKKKVR